MPYNSLENNYVQNGLKEALNMNSAKNIVSGMRKGIPKPFTNKEVAKQRKGFRTGYGSLEAITITE